MRSPIDTSTSPSSSFSSATSICASLFPPTLTRATSGPTATMVPSIVCPCSNRRALTDASNIVAKSSSSPLIAVEWHKEHTNMKPKNTICLWFNKDAHEAARFYAATFPESKVTAVHKAPADYPNGKQGDVLIVEFTVCG